MQKEYRTVLQSAVCEYEEKKSRFIASVQPVATEEEALEFISSLKSKYWNATHNVYAYYIGGEVPAQRFSDDGEPSGTAGMPVLEVIRRMNLQDVVVVVTRYFGGTLLGAAGLIRSYGKAASMGLQEATVIQRKLCTEMNILIEYTLFGKLQNALLQDGYIIQDVLYTQDVEILALIHAGEEEKFLEYITEITNGRGIVTAGVKRYVTLTEDGKLMG